MFFPSRKISQAFIRDVVSIFTLAESGEKKYKNMLHRRKVEKLHDHGRIETRRYTLISARDKRAWALASDFRD